MTKQPRAPDLETVKRLFADLHRTHLEIDQLNLELLEINAMLEEVNRHKRLSRVNKLLNNFQLKSGYFKILITHIINTNFSLYLIGWARCIT